MEQDPALTALLVDLGAKAAAVNLAGRWLERL
jgi:hypothetical protein